MNRISKIGINNEIFIKINSGKDVSKM